MTSKPEYTRRNNLLEKSEENRSRMKRELEAIQVHIPQCMKNLENLQGEDVYFIGATPILAGTFDKFEIEPIVDLLLPKKGPNAKVSNSILFKALLLQIPATGFSWSL